MHKNPIITGLESVGITESYFFDRVVFVLLPRKGYRLRMAINFELSKVRKEKSKILNFELLFHFWSLASLPKRMGNCHFVFSNATDTE